MKGVGGEDGGEGGWEKEEREERRQGDVTETSKPGDFSSTVFH